MNTSSNDAAVIRLTNVVASAIAQFQAGQQQSTRSETHSDQPNLLPAHSNVDVVQTHRNTERYICFILLCIR